MDIYIKLTLVQFQTPLHLACLSGDLLTVEHIVDMVGIEYLMKLHQLDLMTVCIASEFRFGLFW